MYLPAQLCGLLLYALISIASTQERERIWHSTTPGPEPIVSVSSTPEAISTVPTAEVPLAAGTTDSGPVVPSPGVATAEPHREPAGAEQAPRPVGDHDDQNTKDVLTNSGVLKEENKEKKERKWMSVPVEEKVMPREEEIKVEESVTEDKPPTDSVIETVIEETSNATSEATPAEESKVKDKKKKPRKWISIPSEEPAPEPVLEETSPVLPVNVETENVPTESTRQEAVEAVDEYSINAMDMALPTNISDLLLAAEEGVPIVQETIISKKTTVYVTITETLDVEPLFVNLTGIRHYKGNERRMIGGCLDLSDLMINGEEVKEVIQRMSKHKFHKLILSNNNITEFPANTFSPLAFTLRELRLDGNPLTSNDQGEASVLQRGGLFHLTELRELNISGCGLRDMDYFTPWNSNHLEVIDLSNNNLHTVPSNLQFFHKLKKLYIDNNPIRHVTELPFALLWNLQVLSMASCQVTTISHDPFRNMEKLRELSLEGNNLTQIGHVRLPRSNSGVKLFLSGNPWHCACEMLNFIEHYNYAIRDIEYIRCASPRWLEGLRTAYLTKEILSLDSIDGNCLPSSPQVSIPSVMPVYKPALRADRLEVLALAVFVMAAIFMLCHVLWARKKEKYRFEDERNRVEDIHYIRIEKKPNFK